MSEAERAIREALAHATPGQWKHVFSNGGREHYVYATNASYSPTLPGPVKVAWLPYSPGSNRDANDAAFIAACNPENITALLADRDEREAALRAEVEALRAALHTCLWAMRQPIDGWKGDCERKAMDKANAALAQAKEPK